MKLSASFLCATLVLPLSTSLPGQTTPSIPGAPAPAESAPKPGGAALTDKAAADLLRSLNDIATQLDTAKNRHTATALEAFKAAMLSDDKAYSLFMDCKKKVDFDDKGRTGGEWGDYKRRDDTKALHEPEYTAMLKLQLQWLVLTIQAANASTETSYGFVVSQVPAFLEAAQAAWKRMGPARRELYTDVVGSVYGRYYELDKVMEKRTGWCTVPGDLDQICEQTILPYLRGKRNAVMLQNAWQKRIAFDAERIEIEQRDGAAGNNNNRDPRVRSGGNRNEERLIRFREEKLPRLQWGMFKDLFLAGNEAATGPQMLAHIRSNLGHKDATGWIEEFSRLLKHEPPAGAAAKNPPPPAAAVPPVTEPAPPPAGTIRPLTPPEASPAPMPPAPAPPPTSAQPPKAVSF